MKEINVGDLVSYVNEDGSFGLGHVIKIDFDNVSNPYLVQKLLTSDTEPYKEVNLVDEPTCRVGIGSLVVKDENLYKIVDFNTDEKGFATSYILEGNGQTITCERRLFVIYNPVLDRELAGQYIDIVFKPGDFIQRENNYYCILGGNKVWSLTRQENIPNDIFSKYWPLLVHKVEDYEIVIQTGMRVVYKDKLCVVTDLNIESFELADLFSSAMFSNVSRKWFRLYNPVLDQKNIHIYNPEIKDESGSDWDISIKTQNADSIGIWFTQPFDEEMDVKLGLGSMKHGYKDEESTKAYYFKEVVEKECDPFEEELPFKPIDQKVGLKQSEGKLMVQELYWPFIEQMARVMTINKEKYPPKNYLKPMDKEELLAAAQRHTIAIWNGEEIDPTDGQLHSAKVATNMMMYYAQTILYA
jgi:hypothetical protein